MTDHPAPAAQPAVEPLAGAHAQVVVIQRGATRAFDLAAEVPEALVLRGDATDPGLLREAGAEEADYFVAATQNDEANLLSSLLAREMGARSVVAAPGGRQAGK